MNRVLLNVFSIGDANFAIQSNTNRIKELKRLVREKKIKQCIEQKEHYFCTMNINELELSKKLFKKEDLQGFIKKDNGHIPVYEMTDRAYSYFKRFEKFEQLDQSMRNNTPLNSQDVKELSYFVGFKFLRAMSNLRFNIRKEFGMFHSMVGTVTQFVNRYVDAYDSPLTISFANKFFEKVYNKFYETGHLAPVEFSMSEICEPSSVGNRIIDGKHYSCITLILEKMRKNDYGFKRSTPSEAILETKRYICSPLLHECHMKVLYDFTHDLEVHGMTIEKTQPSNLEVKFS